MQRKFRCPDDAWQTFCDTVTEGTPSDKLREMVQGIISPLDSIMGVEEAAERWELAPGYIKNLCAVGDVKAKKIGKTWILDANQPNPKQKPST